MTEKMLLNRLHGEIKKCNEGLPEGVLSLAPVEGESGSNLMNWRASIEGPIGSHYEGGVFDLDIKIPENYPLSPPKVTMLTKIYHPNISSSGYICISILKKHSDQGQWVSGTTLPMLMIALQSLLSDPNPDDPVVPSIAAQMKKPDEFKRFATAWTKRYAMKRTT